MIDTKFFKSEVILGYKCYLTKNNQIDADKQELLSRNKNVYSAKLNKVVEKFRTCLSTGEAFQHNGRELMFLFKNLSLLNGKIEKWNNKWENRVKSSYFSFFLKLIDRIFSIKIKPLDLSKLKEKSEEWKKVLNTEEINEFLEKNAKVYGDLKKAKYICLGENHKDYTHSHVQTMVFNHLQSFHPSRINPTIILEEGADYKYTFNYSPSIIFSKKRIDSGEISVRGWEDLNIHQERWKVTLQRNALIVKAATLRAQGVPESEISSDSEKTKLKELKESCVRLDLLRQEALINSAKKAGEIAERVFIRAGQSHFIDEKASYDIRTVLGEEQCCVVIPKKQVETTIEAVLEYYK